VVRRNGKITKEKRKPQGFVLRYRGSGGRADVGFDAAPVRLG